VPKDDRRRQRAERTSYTSYVGSGSTEADASE
jgi:hypothetical protein